MIYKEVEIFHCPDCGPNKGGYYCTVYIRKDDWEIDNFCIHPDELAVNPDVDCWIMSYMESVYDSYIQEGLIQSVRSDDENTEGEKMLCNTASKIKRRKKK